MIRLLCISLFCLMALPQLAQQDSARAVEKSQYKRGVKYIIETAAGTRHTGFIVEESQDFITLENRNIHEKMEIRKSEIVSAKPYPERKHYEDDVLGENNHAGNYLFSGSAFEFKPGEVVTNNHWVLLQSVDYALSENWAFTSNAIAFYPLSLGLKCAYKVSERDFIGTHVFGVGNVFNSNTGNSMFWGYGALAKYTRGSTNRNITFSGGVLGINSQIFSPTPGTPFINLGFVNVGYCNRFHKNVAFVGEGWYFPSTQALIGGIGIKLVGNENYSWSFGCYSFLDTYNNTLQIDLKTIPIPYIGIGRKFD